MAPEEKHLFCVASDAFLLAKKWLREGQPNWEPGSRSNQMIAKWPIDEAGRDESRAYLVFSVYKATRDQPSVSLIFQGREICRVDVKPRDSMDQNPSRARQLGLPSIVYGTHMHPWEFNRNYVLEELHPDEWKIPNKMPISQSTRNPGQILACICTYCGIGFTGGQKVFYPPRPKAFGGGKP